MESFWLLEIGPLSFKHMKADFVAFLYWNQFKIWNMYILSEKNILFF